jgi:uncharacterized membrane protein
MSLVVLNPFPILAVWPIRLEYFSGWVALLLFLVLGAPIVLLGVRSLAGLGKTRQRVAIVIRLLVILLIVLLLGGIRYQRTSKDLEIMVLRDISTSTSMVTEFPAKNLKDSIDEYLKAASSVKDKPPDDRIGEISFQQDALIDALPNTHLVLTGSKAIRAMCTGTDPSAAIQLGLATMQKDAMHRLLLIWDGNPTLGDLDAAKNAAIAAHVPIDVMPLHYDVQHEVMMDKIVAPTWKRKNEPFTIDIILKSTNDFPVTGKLTVTDQGVPMNLDLTQPGMHTSRMVTLPAGSSDHPAEILEQVKVPAQESAGVHQFHAAFDTDQPGAQVGVNGQSATAGGQQVDTLSSNNAGDAFTYVQGKGRILYVDNVPDGRGNALMDALNEEGVEITPQDHITPEQFPGTAIKLQDFDAVILANVPYGPGGLTDDDQRNLASYVHDSGGGLVMIGGPDTFGAGGWEGKKLEEVLPVDMDIPATRQIPKGALVMVMHSCEFPDGNYFGEQCAIKAIETLSSQDEIGIVSYSWSGGASQWDFPLGPKGDGSKPIAAAKQMQVGDMMSFEDSMYVALHGSGVNKGLIDSDAKQKHVIIISDGDPAGPSPALIAEYKAAQVTVSTVNVYPHDLTGISPTLIDIARQLKGKSYGPISKDFAQLPQIFVKEATVVRRSLISENANGIALNRRPSSSDMVKGIGNPLPMIKGLVLTSRKNNPQIQLPIVAGVNSDPLLASWQTGLGRAAVYTSDANNQWGAAWMASPDYNKLWAQVVRGVARPPASNQFDVNITQDGNRGHIVVDSRDKDTGFMNFLNVAGSVLVPDNSKPAISEHLVQTGPGRYEGDFDMNDAGTYVARLQYRDQNGNEGFLPVSGLSMNSSPELRDLKSNDELLKDVAESTGGRMLPAFDAEHANLFDRDKLPEAVSSLPIWDRIIPVLLALILIDVAARRIAWDWVAMKRYFASSVGFVRSFTITRKVETRGSLDALQRIRGEGETKPTTPPGTGKTAPPPKPDPKAKFEAKGVEGDITNVVGGATDKPIPSAPKKIEPKGLSEPGGGMSSLMEAKRRAQQKIEDIKDKEKPNP